MIHPKLRHLPLAAAALVACSGAFAGYQSPDGHFSLSGFGTLGLSKTNSDEAYFAYPGQAGGATKHASFDPDSKIAVQGTYKFTPTLSGTAQVMTKFDAEGQYEPKMEWAFAKWQATPGLSFRAGRMGAPIFMISDFRDVGYANTAVRPNLDVYGQVPVSSFEGGDVSYQTNLGSMTLTSSFWAGKATNKYASALHSLGQANAVAASEVVLSRIKGLNLQGEFDNGWSWRAGYLKGKLAVNSPTAEKVIGYAEAASGTDADKQDAVSRLTTDNVNASFTGVGLTYDQDNIVLSAEYGKRGIDKKGYIPALKGWYALAGYRLGSVLPYVSMSRLSVTNPNASVDGALTRLGPFVQIGSTALFNTQKLNQDTKSMGVRWDARSGVAVKAQYDYVAIPKNSNGQFLVDDAASAVLGGSKFLNKPKDISVLTLSVDFVF
ncbi:hypothetical protein [Aquabacterium sp.]|uniref:hypothetical protein n=1 Tax=Aquabacterium sp. TaxID=1872578 RepID=UPI002E34918E|nr:hypothetical protein [Aquabacterium sp.]HEX5310426.1 hypothetical protein [Aquabacterium sp.]